MGVSLLLWSSIRCTVYRKTTTPLWSVTGNIILLQCPREDCHSMVTSHRRPHPPAVSSGRLPLYGDQSPETTSSCSVLRKIATLWWPVTGDHILLQCPQEDCHSMVTSHRRPHPPAVSSGRLPLYGDQSQEITSSCNVLRKIATLWWPVTGDNILLQCPQEDCHSMVTIHRRPHPPAVSSGRLPLYGDQSPETTSSCSVLRKIATLWWPVTGDHILLQCPQEDCHSMVTSHRR